MGSRGEDQTRCKRDTQTPAPSSELGSAIEIGVVIKERGEASKTETTLIAVSRHIGKLGLIRPWDLCRKETPPEARRLHDLFEEHVFFRAPAYTLTRLAQEVFDVVVEDDAECWVSNAFNALPTFTVSAIETPVFVYANFT